jgi:predicted site-specific integrase-resolvase
MTTRDPHVMTLAEAARAVGVSVDTLERYIAKGAVTVFRTPTNRRYVDVRECLPRPTTTTSTR